MRSWRLGALAALIALLGGCSSNSTPVAVMITTTSSGATNNSITIIESTSALFSATVSGASSSEVFWQICLTPEVAGKPNSVPTNCTVAVGPQQCANVLPKVSNPISGFGTMSLTGDSIIYTAPPAPTTPDSFLLVATSCVDITKFGTFTITVDSGIRVTISPASATIGETETLQFFATVTGTNNLGVSWEVCSGSANGGGSNCMPSGTITPEGMISASGLYTAPAGTTSAVIEAISAADQNQTGTATVSVAVNTAPTVTAIDPPTAAQGSAQQDVYLTGTNFFATTNVIIQQPGGAIVTLPAANVNILSTTLLRATIPGSDLAQGQGVCSGAAAQCTIQVGVQDQEGNPQSTIGLILKPARPGLIGELPQSVLASGTSTPTITLTGGFFSPPTTVNGNPAGTTASFNGQSVTPTMLSSRELSLTLLAGSVTTPGLYPIVVQNAGITAGQPSSAALNLGVTPLLAATGGTSGSVGVGANPSAIAIDEADGIAVVANTGGNSVSLIGNLNTTPSIIGTVTVGNSPTGVAVDDLLPDSIALVLNSADQTVTAIDLCVASAGTNCSGKSVIVNPNFLPISIGPKATSPVPLAIGVNPVTHRVIVAYQSTNQATVFGVSDVISDTITNEVQISGTAVASFQTGPNPAIAIDPQLNWAAITPGGTGAVTLVDLGLVPNTIPGFAGSRQPQAIGSIPVAASVQGIGINSETHQAIFSNPQTGAVSEASLLNFSTTAVTQSGSNFVDIGAGAAAASALENVGIVVTGSTPGASAAIVNLGNGDVLQTIPSSAFAGSANLQAVAVDPVTNQALAVDQKNGLVYFISLGLNVNPNINQLQIVNTSPAIVFGGPASGNVTLTINGSGFTKTSNVLLDGTPVTSFVGGAVTLVSPRQIVATLPGGATGPLGMPRRYAVQVENSGSVSNVTGLEVVQAAPVGTAPVGVAIDTDRHLAVVTNSIDGTVSLVALTAQTPFGPTQTPAGSIGAVAGPITVGTTPAGVATMSRLGLALVADSGSNNANVVDVVHETTTTVCQSGNACGGTGQTGVAIDQDTGTGFVTATNLTSPTSPGGVLTVTVPTGAGAAGPIVDHNPVAVAVDTNPLFPFAAVATDSSSSTVDFLDMAKGDALVERTSGLQNPSGIIFDPVNQVFVVANSLQNQVVIIDPTTFLGTPISVGIGPTSLDYDFQTSTLVTDNSISQTLSLLSYVCPPSLAEPACVGPQVSTVLGLGGTQATAPIFGANAVAVDPILNLAVLVDEDNNQVLLVPLPY